MEWERHVILGGFKWYKMLTGDIFLFFLLVN